MIVTALRIIEREEKSDAEFFTRQKSTGFIATGRPKKWKEKVRQLPSHLAIFFEVNLSCFSVSVS